MKSLFLFLLLIPILAIGQINVTGVTKSKTEGIYFSQVNFKHSDGTSYSTVSNEKFEYKIKIKPGLYNVTSSYLGYSTFSKEINIISDLTLDIVFEESKSQLSEFVIRATPQKVTEIAIVGSIRNSNVVSDGISTEFIKKTPDRNLGDALKRVSGVTIQNDKFDTPRYLRVI